MSVVSLSAAPATRSVALWLFVIAVLVFAMVTVGGVTRLTRSGLSIVEWNPVMGVIPPLTQAAWTAEFEKYQRTPEYQKVNTGIALDAFKRIYYVEWTHRLLGRLIGLAFLVPLVYFAVRRQLPPRLLAKLVAIFVLGGLQGALGWFMVQSGLVDIPRVSPYRLTAHLGLAVVIYGYVLWVALDLVKPAAVAPPDVSRLRRFGWGITSLVFITILAGGFVAGTRAGFAFNTFPLMNGHLLPPGLYAMDPWWVNLFENVATVQLNHRLLATVLLLGIVRYWWSAGRLVAGSDGIALHLLLAAAILQVALGIATLLLVVPVSLGAAHQGGALLVFTFALYLNHALRRR